jgi:hypothetical protein
MLSRFTGIDQRSTLFPQHRTQAEQVLALYDEYARV